MPMVSDAVLQFARDQFERLVDELLDDPSDLLHPDRDEEPPRVIFGYRKLAFDLGFDFDTLVSKGGGLERKRLSDIERGIEKPLLKRGARI